MSEWYSSWKFSMLKISWSQQFAAADWSRGEFILCPMVNQMIRNERIKLEHYIYNGSVKSFIINDYEIASANNDFGCCSIVSVRKDIIMHSYWSLCGQWYHIDMPFYRSYRMTYTLDTFFVRADPKSWSKVRWLWLYWQWVGWIRVHLNRGLK